MENKLTVHKCDYQGNDVFAYPATILRHNEEKMVVRANFTSHKDYNIAGLELKNGDKCLEVFYFHRWFNIFEVYAGESDQIRGWYCNITKPAIYKENHLYYYDLALDVISFSDGRQVIVDEDQFMELPLDDETRQKAKNELQDLCQLLKKEVPLRY
ncbi:DUF402 domain-containing protein [Candidatus Uabimicrobium amorphum]|uniref:DUF402 domain-containing protein n=1 Tax=Uabimicrobium amorphum TaxID=2596890 RepID=A0A5S9II86_UABAM|nr:DUF402 domain-containing protein [Candidatus Uabimicrobium amorphum]BBM82318.1 hypothetical protein UABAM_00661 [Candidatus Uabimicrobium amorphum]